MKAYTRVVNLKKQPYDVYIGRGSIFGNPFTHKDGTTAEFIVESRSVAVEKYREYIMNKPELLARIPELKGKTLGCFCKPLSCHGDVLAELANADNYGELFDSIEKDTKEIV